MKEARNIKVASFLNRVAICCPFHAEETPSCVLDNTRGIDNVEWHCLGCGRYGFANWLGEDDHGPEQYRLEVWGQGDK